ncbi:MAG: TraR/DksA C4-type zinc finger protein [Nitrospirae bacterium]|nr:TraR/DksA C4-type zinc finger protein [Nitrospirota bacterium]
MPAKKVSKKPKKGKTAKKKSEGKKPIKKLPSKKKVSKTPKKGKTAQKKKVPQKAKSLPLKKKPRALSVKQADEEKKEALRRALIQKRETIVREAKSEIKNYITGENRQLVETALDDGDWSVIDLSEDVSLRKLSTHRETLLKIDEALRKLREGTYGICEDCADEIAPERLKILPFAIYCRDCQEKNEMLASVEKSGA